MDLLDLITGIAEEITDINWVITAEIDDTIVDHFNNLTPEEQTEVRNFIENYVSGDTKLSRDIGILLNLVNVGGPYWPGN